MKTKLSKDGTWLTYKGKRYAIWDAFPVYGIAVGAAKDYMENDLEAMVAVYDMGPGAGRLRYGVFVRKVRRNAPSKWHLDKYNIASGMHSEALNNKDHEMATWYSGKAAAHRESMTSADKRKADRMGNPPGTRFKEGDRVISTGYSFNTGVPDNMTGTVGAVATGRGKSIYPDPSRIMVFVNWDNGDSRGVFKWELEKIKGAPISKAHLKGAYRHLKGNPIRCSNPVYVRYKGKVWRKTDRKDHRGWIELVNINDSSLGILADPVKIRPCSLQDSKAADKLYHRSNPILPSSRVPKGAVKIYDKIEAIEATKGKNSLWPNQPFRHDFKGSSEAEIYGLPDGSLLVKSKKGRKLHKMFNYPEKTRKKNPWQGKLRDEYASYEEWEHYSDTYGLAKRLGFSSAEAAWDSNPTIQGSTDPKDYKVVKQGKRN